VSGVAGFDYNGDGLRDLATSSAGTTVESLQLWTGLFDGGYRTTSIDPWTVTRPSDGGLAMRGVVWAPGDGGTHVVPFGYYGFRQQFVAPDGGVGGVGQGGDLLSARPVHFARAAWTDFLTRQYDGATSSLFVFTQNGVTFSGTELCLDATNLCGTSFDVTGKPDVCLGDFRATAGASVPSVVIASSASVDVHPYVRTDTYGWPYFSSTPAHVGTAGVAGLLELDVNGDGAIDLVTVTGATPPVLSVILGAK
jgi:hypothetical protein